jgi:hypothetical protein
MLNKFSETLKNKNQKFFLICGKGREGGRKEGRKEQALEVEELLSEKGKRIERLGRKVESKRGKKAR